MLTVVEQEGDRTRWNGTVPFVLRFTRASTLAIGIQNNNNNNVDVQVAYSKEYDWLIEEIRKKMMMIMKN